jgi:hypothetical protein
MPPPKRSEARARKAAELRAQQARQARNRRLVVAGSAVTTVLVVLGVLVAVGLTRGTPTSSPAAGTGGPAPAAVVGTVTTVPPSVLAAVGAGGTKQSLFALDGRPLRSGGKPLVLYVGAEYCPFCAAERWPVVVALSRFGTWSRLGATTSAADDVYPNTPTFSFHGASFASPYLTFEGVETQTNKRSGTGYESLDTLTPEQRRIFETYNAPPYVPASAAGSIPFIDLAGRYGVSGSGYDPAVLQGKTLEQIAEEVHAGTGPAGRAILGHANRITAAVCAVTGGRPADVCAAAPVAALTKDLPGVP